jgi:hypothetical protein
MMADNYIGSRQLRGLYQSQPGRIREGRALPTLPWRYDIDIKPERAIAQTKMTISQPSSMACFVTPYVLVGFTSSWKSVQADGASCCSSLVADSNRVRRSHYQKPRALLAELFVMLGGWPVR